MTSSIDSKSLKDIKSLSGDIKSEISSSSESSDPVLKDLLRVDFHNEIKGTVRDAIIIASIDPQWIYRESKYFEYGGARFVIDMKKNLIHNLKNNEEAMNKHIILVDYKNTERSYLFKVQRVVNEEDAKHLGASCPLLYLSPLIAVNTLVHVKEYINTLDKSWGVQQFWTIIPDGIQQLYANRIPYVKPNEEHDGIETTAGKPGFVYFMYERDRKRVKIGYSNNPRGRHLTARTTNSDIELLAFVPCDNALKFEQHLHAAYAVKKYRGEFYTLTEDEVIELVNWLSSSGSSS